MRSCIPRDTNVLDIGANIGTHSISMSQYVGSGKVFAEPVRHIRNDLQLNVKLSSTLSNKIIILSNAVGYKNIQKSMFVVKEDDFNQGSSSLVEDQYLATEDLCRNIHQYKVDVIRVDDFIESTSVNDISFIKTDIEGYEYEALLGMQVLLPKEKPTLVIEFNIDRIRYRGLDHNDLQSVLPGYSCYEIIRDNPSNNKELYALEPFFFDRYLKGDLACFPL